MMRKLTVSLLAFLAVLFICSNAYASPYMPLEPASTGECVSVTEDGSGYVDVTSGYLFWAENFLSYGSQTAYISRFGLIYVGNGNGVAELGGAWRHTYSMSLNYVAGTSLSLTTRYNTTIPFTFVAGSTWVSNAGYGVHLTCVVNANSFTLTDKYGNFITFDSSGRPTSIGDYFSTNTIALAYSNGLLSTVTDSCNRTYTLNYNASNLISSLTDNTVTGNPTWLVLTYNGSDLTNIQKGYTTGILFANYSFGYANGTMTSYTDPDNVAISFSYTGGLLTGATDPANNTWSLTYNVGNTVYTDRNGLPLTYSYDTSTPPCITSILWPAPQAGGVPATEIWTYDFFRNCLSHTTKGGSTTTFTYDTNGNRLASNGPAGTGYNWAWTYSATSQLLRKTDPRGNITIYQYYASGLLWRVIYADDNAGNPTHPLVYAYNAANSLVSSITDPRGFATSYTYDTFKCKASVIQSPDGILTYTTSYTNDSWGNVTQTTNALNYVTKYNYNSLGHLSSVQVQYDTLILPTYSTTSYTYQPSGKVLTVTDPLNNTTTHYYDSLGRRYATRYPTVPFTYTRTNFDAEGNIYGFEDKWMYNYNVTNSTSWYTYWYSRDNWARVISTNRIDEDTSTNPSTWLYRGDSAVYNADSNRTSYTGYNGNTTSYTYNSLGWLISETDPYLNSNLRGYDNIGNLVSYTNKRGFTTSYTYDARNRKSTEIVPLATNNTTAWIYDHNSNVTSVTDRLNNTTSYTYDRLNRQLTKVNAYSATVKTLGYDALGHFTSRTDFYSNTWTTSYYPQGQTYQTVAPDNGTSTSYYDLAGNLTRTVDEVGSDTRYTYDSLNRRTQVTYAWGQPEQYSKSVVYSLGRKTRDVDGVGNYTDYAHYNNGRLKTTDYYMPVANSTHSVTTFYYDAQGNRIEVNNPLGNSTYYDYDQMNRNYKIRKPSGNHPEWHFDANGNKDWSEDGLNNRTNYSYDSMDRCWRVTDPAGNNADKTFDAMGNVLTTTVSPDGGITLHTTRYTYTNLYKVATITDPLNNIHTNSFDNAGRLTSYVDKNGNTVTMSQHDNCGRVTQITHPAPLNPANNMTTDINYDLKGRASSYNSPDLQRWYTYDMNNRVTQEEQYMPAWPQPGRMVANYSYDNTGRLTSVNDFQNVATGYSYNDAILQKSVTEGNRTHTLDFDAAGFVTKKTLSTGMNENYTYDTSGRLGATVVRHSGGSVLGMVSYGYDNADKVTGETGSGFYTNYSRVLNYNSRSLLTSETRTGSNPTTNTYQYDGMGCRTQKNINGVITNYTYNGLGRITAANGVPYSYDNNGNLLSKGTETFTYDWKNNLVRYQDSSNNSDYYLGYDIGNTLVAKGWENSRDSQSSSSTTTKKVMRGIPAVLTAKAVFTTATTRTPGINCFADLNNPEEEFFIKSYNTSSIYNLMYEDASLQSFTMLRHWNEAGNAHNKYVVEFNYDAQDPTGLALGVHFGTQDYWGSYLFSTDLAQAMTTQSVLDWFNLFNSITGAQLEWKGADNNHRPVANSLYFGTMETYATDAPDASSVQDILSCEVEGVSPLEGLLECTTNPGEESLITELFRYFIFIASCTAHLHGHTWNGGWKVSSTNKDALAESKKAGELGDYSLLTTEVDEFWRLDFGPDISKAKSLPLILGKTYPGKCYMIQGSSPANAEGPYTDPKPDKNDPDKNYLVAKYNMSSTCAVAEVTEVSLQAYEASKGKANALLENPPDFDTWENGDGDGTKHNCTSIAILVYNEGMKADGKPEMEMDGNTETPREARNQIEKRNPDAKVRRKKKTRERWEKNKKKREKRRKGTLGKDPKDWPRFGPRIKDKEKDEPEEEQKENVNEPICK